jgi:hypothetical protein
MVIFNMSNNVSLIAVDLDGTLLTSHRHVNLMDAEILRRISANSRLFLLSLILFRCFYSVGFWEKIF